MKIDTLLAISPIDGRYANQLDDLRPICSEFALIKTRLTLEIKWLCTIIKLIKSNKHKLSPSQEKKLHNIITNFSLIDAKRIKTLEQITQHDVKAIEYFLQEKLTQSGELLAALPFIHFGCTSDDINNLAYALMLKAARQTILLPTLTQLTTKLVTLAKQHAAIPMLARTHGQPASPTTVGKEIVNFAYRLQQQIAKLAALELKGKITGATGNFNAHYAAFPTLAWPSIAEHFVEELGLTWNPATTQIEPHDYLAEFANNLALINTILIGFCRDIWGYIALDYFTQNFATTTVGSSTMPHKVNPIDFENAEGNLGLANTLLQHFANKLPISRWQRDLSDSTVLRNIGVAFAHSLLAYKSLAKGLTKIAVNQNKTKQDLENHWEILGEAIQTILRAEGASAAYEKIKAHTRGKNLNQAEFSTLVQQLNLNPTIEAKILKLTPSNYVGCAVEITRKICKEIIRKL